MLLLGDRTNKDKNELVLKNTVSSIHKAVVDKILGTYNMGGFAFQTDPGIILTAKKYA